ncbi:pilus assembly protein [Streptomyces sp. MUM 178J]|uniref:pilus assembly protein n=1 Tax=Streptomyces sp. MUM 178J TaxID=2791991 RepID=UPI001F040B1B|nr:pilus assembly protein [Streptomyces sp. MUM 178J]WRQ81612.1 pilus assembly protein [Streptomyces sp. MUM 178J]
MAESVTEGVVTAGHVATESVTAGVVTAGHVATDPLTAGVVTAGLARDDRGQSVIEFTGMVPIILVTLAVLWQSALVGYTLVLAGNAADQAVRAGTVAEGGAHAACERAGGEHIPGAWSYDIDCGRQGDVFTARADLRVPLLFPGAFNLPVTVPGRAAAATERRDQP